MDTTERSPLRSIRLNRRQEQELLDRLDAANDSAGGANRRTDPRARFRPASPVVVIIHQPNGAETSFAVLPRNISAGGFGFVHGQFIHFPLKCIVMLPTLDGETLSMRGSIVSCRHVNGLIHDVSVVFIQHIDPTLFVEESTLVTPTSDRDALAAKPTGPAEAVMAGKRIILLGTASAGRLAAAAMKGAQCKPVASKDVPALLATLRAQIDQGLVVYEVQPGQGG